MTVTRIRPEGTDITDRWPGSTGWGKAFREARRGAVAVELALLAPVLAFMLVGAIDFGNYIYQRMQLKNASRAGAQYAIQSSSDPFDNAAIDAVVRAASNIDAGASVTSGAFCGCVDGSESAPDSLGVCSGTCAGGEFPALFVRVTVSDTFSTLFPYPGIPDTLTLQGQTSLQVP